MDRNRKPLKEENPAPPIEEIFSRIEKEEAAADAAPRAPSGGSEDLKSLKVFREKLLAYSWARSDVYRISDKFFGRRTAAQLDEQFQKLIHSMQYSATPEENHDFALKVLLDEMTSADAVKKSLIRKKASDLRQALESRDWAQGYVELLVQKYAGDKTADELATKFRLIMADIPDEGNPGENRELALKVLLDWSNYSQITRKIEKVRYRQELLEIFDQLPDDYAQKATERFFEREKAAALLIKCDALLKEIGGEAHPERYTLAMRALLGELTKDEARLEVRGLKNKEDITRIVQALALSDTVAGRLKENYSGKNGKWFDSEFPELFNSLDRYSGSDKANAVLAVKVLSGEIDEASARGLARGERNKDDISTLAREVALPAKLEAELLTSYAAPSPPLFNDDYNRFMLSLPKSGGGLNKSLAILAVKLMLKKITRDAATRTADVIQVFNRFSLPQEDMDAIIAKYLYKKTAEELLFSFESILDRLPYVEAKSENYGLAVKVILDDDPKAIDKAIRLAVSKRDRTKYRNALNAYGWFIGYASELAEKYFSLKSPSALITHYENILASLPHSAKPADNYDLGLRVILDRMSLEEAKREAALRKELRAIPWAKDFACEIVGGYLGTKGIEQVIKRMGGVFESCEFWKTSPAKHKYAVELMIRELNGGLPEAVTAAAVEFLNTNIPLDSVKEITAFFEQNPSVGLDAKELLRKYLDLADAYGEHGKAVEKFKDFLSKSELE